MRARDDDHDDDDDHDEVVVVIVVVVEEEEQEEMNELEKKCQRQQTNVSNERGAAKT